MNNVSSTVEKTSCRLISICVAAVVSSMVPRPNSSKSLSTCWTSRVRRSTEAAMEANIVRKPLCSRSNEATASRFSAKNRDAERAEGARAARMARVSAMIDANSSGL